MGHLELIRDRYFLPFLILCAAIGNFRSYVSVMINIIA